MGCPAECVIGDNLVFTVTTHDPDTGVLTDADAPPTYRVYEDETGAAILNGSMAILDNANTTGFYSELIACTAANGFENGRTYSIYVEATVDGDTGGISFGFKAIDPLATSAQVDRNVALAESHFGSHTWQGNLYYVDPVNGDTFANGNRGGRDDPLDSVQDCHDNLITDSNHDVIILVAGDPSTPTTMTEDVTFTSRYVFIRGPGRDFIWTRSGAGDTISIDADGVCLSGFQLNTAGVGSGNGIQITDADFVAVENVWINATRGDGINILRGDNCQIVGNTFTDTGQVGSGEGIHIVGTAGSSNGNVIRDNDFRDIAGDAILIEQGSTFNTTIQKNTIEGAAGWGINIGASSTDAVITDNRFANNSSGDITDAGTTTVQLNNEQWATDADATTILARLGAFTGTGINTILGFFQALFRSDAAAPSDVGGTFDPATEAVQAIRDRGDAAWITGGGGGITDILNMQPLIPFSIDLANTATWRVGLMLTNALDNLPSTAEITPGTIDIDRKTIGATAWTSIVSGAACSELAGLVYYDEVFDSGTGYAEGDSIRITFYGQLITVAANDYEIIDASGRQFYTEIRQSIVPVSISAVEFSYPVTDTSGDPIAGATVWIATDEAGNNVVWVGVTDSFGIARHVSNNALPFLDPGTYYVWTQTGLHSFDNPDTEVVS